MAGQTRRPLAQPVSLTRPLPRPVCEAARIFAFARNVSAREFLNSPLSSRTALIPHMAYSSLPSCPLSKSLFVFYVKSKCWDDALFLSFLFCVQFLFFVVLLFI